MFKARLVAKGFTQEERINFSKMFSPVVRHTPVRALLSIVAHFNLELQHMDVTTTFLYGTLDEDIYMKQPPGFIKPGE